MEKELGTKKEIKETQKQQRTAGQIKKLIKRIRKANKLYVRAPNGSLLRVSELSQNISDQIIVGFMTGDHKKLYSLANKDVKKVSDLKPVNFKIAKEFAQGLDKIIQATGEESFIVYINDSNRPLATVSLKS